MLMMPHADVLLVISAMYAGPKNVPLTGRHVIYPKPKSINPIPISSLFSDLRISEDIWDESETTRR